MAKRKPFKTLIGEIVKEIGFNLAWYADLDVAAQYTMAGMLMYKMCNGDDILALALVRHILPMPPRKQEIADRTHLYKYLWTCAKNGGTIQRLKMDCYKQGARLDSGDMQKLSEVLGDIMAEIKIEKCGR